MVTLPHPPASRMPWLTWALLIWTIVVTMTLTGCITVDRRTVVAPVQPPAFTYPSWTPDGTVQCWPVNRPLDQCVRTL